MHSLSKVAIIISTYNGHCFFREQLESILCQSYTNFHIFIRDDGSTDKDFLNYLKSLEAIEKLSVVFGQNIGVIKSFFELLKICGDNYDYVSFADQDDVWLKDKLCCALEILDNGDNLQPQLYIGRLQYVDENLREQGVGPDFKRLGFANALVQNLATGCVSVINQKARLLVLNTSPKVVLMHDWWVYIVVSAFGRVIFDSRINFLYRQHSKNAVGGTPSFIKQMQRRIYRFAKMKKGNYRVYDQALEFYNCYQTLLSSENESLIKNFLTSKSSFMERLFYIFKSGTVWRHRKIDTFILKILILINKY